MKQARQPRSMKMVEPSSYIFIPASRASRIRLAMFIEMITTVLVPAIDRSIRAVSNDAPLLFGTPSAAHSPTQNDIAIIANGKSTFGNSVGTYCITNRTAANARNARCPKSMVLVSELIDMTTSYREDASHTLYDYEKRILGKYCC